MSENDQAMWGFVQARELPFVLTRLSDFTIQEATPAYFEQINIPPSEVLGCSVFDLMDPEERPRAREELQALADGTIDFYRTVAYLKRLTVSVLKIDREFVRDLCDEVSSQHVASAVVSLAKAFGPRPRVQIALRPSRCFENSGSTTHEDS